MRMKRTMFGVGVAVVLWTMAGLTTARAQAVPTGATGKCNDGSYTSAAKKWQACSKHQGVQSWFADGPGRAAVAAGRPAPMSTAATPAPATATPAASGPTQAMTGPAPAPVRSKPSATRATGAQRAVAPGGGPGLVWVNTESKVYHCPGSADYGTTKAGKYISEAEAKQAGARANRNVGCTK